MKLLPPMLHVESRPDGTQLVRNREPLKEYPRNILQLIEAAAAAYPDRVFAAERDSSGTWIQLTYRKLLERCAKLGAGMRQHGLDTDRPLMVMARNSLDHLSLALAAQCVGIPYVPVTPAYAQIGTDRAKLRHVLELVRPGVVFLDQADCLSEVAPLLRATGAAVLSATGSEVQSDILCLNELEFRARGGQSISQDVPPDALAKVLFTSGSTGLPKAVRHTHRMMLANIEMMLQVWPDLMVEPPILVDWLPWNHCFGSNNNINLVLRLAGTLYIDGGRPVPGQFEISLQNLKAIAPTMYFNVPSGFALLADACDRDPDFRKHFFSRLQGVFFAGAAMDLSLWKRLQSSAASEGRESFPILSGWGATETGPTATLIQGGNEGVGNIGLPAPGVTIKLAPSGEKYELRVKSPSVTSGYLSAPDDTEKAFDTEGFYRTGDAGRWVDPNDPRRGIAFDGRLTNDFKLANGTWVSFAPLRASILALADCIKDVVICGHDRPYLSLMIWLKEGWTDDQHVCETLSKAIAIHNAGAKGASQRIEDFSLQNEPLSFDAGEITEKGTVNQRIVRERRRAALEALYATVSPDGSSCE